MFQDMTLRELTVNFDSQRQPVKSSDRKPGIFPYFGASGVVDHVDDFLFDGKYLLIAEDGENLRSRSTPIAFLAEGRFWVNNHAHVLKASDQANLRFLMYKLSITDVSGYLTGSAQPKLSRSSMDSIRLRVPEITVQNAIAEVLGALDDKIATNTKLSATVDDFLGARFQRELAAGFEFASLKNIADVNAEAVKPVANQSLRYIDIASVGVGTHTFPRLTPWENAPSRARRRVRRGDTLWSTVRPNRRSHSLNLSSDPALVGSTGLAVLSPKDIGFAYLYETTRLPEFTTYLENVAEGSAYPAVRAEQFKSAPVPLLSPEKRVAFEDLAAPMREHAHALDEENRTLAELRDTLLPELMSGRLRVKDAEKKVEEVV